MTTMDVFSLALTMMLMAALPSVSVMLVTSQALSAGFRAGAMTVAGVVAGDLILILITMTGLAFIYDMLSGYEVYFKYLAAVCLTVMALWLYRSRTGRQRTLEASKNVGTVTGFVSGLALTLADHKAILFYLGILPTFINLNLLTTRDVVLVLLVTVVSVGGVKLVYAWLASVSAIRLTDKPGKILHSLAAFVLLLLDAWLVLSV